MYYVNNKSYGDYIELAKFSRVPNSNQKIWHIVVIQFWSLMILTKDNQMKHSKTFCYSHHKKLWNVVSISESQTSFAHPDHVLSAQNIWTHIFFKSLNDFRKKQKKIVLWMWRLFHITFFDPFLMNQRSLILKIFQTVL
jgi:hypothetical protein